MKDRYVLPLNTAEKGCAFTVTHSISNAAQANFHNGGHFPMSGGVILIYEK